jgi:CubicO group peptidase (beta-lactamase class C family)
MKRNLISSATFMMVFALLLSGIFNSVIAQSSARQKEAEAGKLIEEYNNNSTPGGAVMVIRNGKVVYSKAFGMANLTHNVPFQITTPTNIGSTTKQFTAFAIALLEERGQLSINDDVRKYITIIRLTFRTRDKPL